MSYFKNIEFHYKNKYGEVILIPYGESISVKKIVARHNKTIDSYTIEQIEKLVLITENKCMQTYADWLNTPNEIYIFRHINKEYGFNCKIKKLKLYQNVNAKEEIEFLNKFQKCY